MEIAEPERHMRGFICPVKGCRRFFATMNGYRTHYVQHPEWRRLGLPRPRKRGNRNDYRTTGA